MGPTLRFIIKRLLELFLTPFKLFPIEKNKIFLLNDLMAVDSDFSSNPKYIANHLLGKENYKIYYALGSERYKNWKNGEHSYPKEVCFVKLYSFKYFYHALTAKFFITTSGGISYMPFRKEQKVINTWHGGGAYKKMGLDATKDKNLYKALKMSESKTDYFISSNAYFSEAIQTAFLIPKEKIIESGLPRNDLFFKTEEEQEKIKNKVYDYYQIDKSRHIVLYAPTYRSANESIFKEHVLGPYELNFDDVLNSLERKFHGKWIFAVRLHPSLRKFKLNLPKNVIDMSDYEDPQELLVTAEVLINDYSSTMWDFALSYKPCFLYTPDLSSYDSKLGFYTDPKSWPFPIAETNEELNKLIMNFESQSYNENLKKYFKWMNSFETGEASKKIECLLKEELENEIDT